MSNTSSDGEDYPANTPLDEEPERFIDGSAASTEAEDVAKDDPDEPPMDESDDDVNDG